MDIEWMREHIKNVPRYGNSPKWHMRCNNMSTAQVVAVYNAFNRKGMFQEKKPKVKYTQISLFDIYPEVMGRKAEV